MNFNDIISKDYHNLESFSNSLKKKYLVAEPFPNIELNNFFNQNFLEKILKEFPDLSILEKKNK